MGALLWSPGWLGATLPVEDSGPQQQLSLADDATSGSLDTWRGWKVLDECRRLYPLSIVWVKCSTSDLDMQPEWN